MHDTLLYIESPKDIIRELLKLISEFGKVLGYKINTQKSVACLHTNNEESERKMKELISFTTTTKRIKYLEKLETKNYTQKNKIPMKEMKNNKDRWRNIPCS